MRRLRTLAAATAPLALILTPLAPGAPTGPVATAAESEDLTSYVNAFVGTQNFGNTFPGASAPFGMVQVSPDTGGQGGYDYTRDQLYGFSQTHLSGVGCEVMGELPIMPTSGQVAETDHDAYASTFSHDNEEAEPGYYRVHLDRYGVDAELTATPRTGWQRYAFDPARQANVLFNTGKAQQRVFDSRVQIVGDRRVQGRIHAGNFCAGLDRHTVYFAAEFDRPFDSFGTWKDDTTSPGSRRSSNGEGSNGAWVSFDPATDDDVVLKVGLSYTGVAGARRNLDAETGDSFDFDATRQALHDEWNAMLHRVEVDGGTEERRTAFYTALYHALVHPNLAGDVDGRYRGFDGEIHQATGYTPYQNFSLWDTYRPQNQLLALLAPDVARDTYRSLIAHGREGGWLPRWSLANSETNIMTGDPVTPFLVEGWAKGLLRGDAAAEAYRLLRKNATGTPPADSAYNGRAGQDYYAERGYIPHGLDREADCAHKGGDNDCSHGVSATLEYAASDAALSLMARGLGKSRDARMFAARAQSYRNVWDTRIDHFRPRTPDGVWLDSYDPAYGAGAFHEGGAYQYQWLAPQDPDGLTELMGGREATAQRLDDFFAYEDLLTDPEGTAREDWVSGPFEYYGEETYNPNNEPDLLAPYLYAWVGQPHKTATVVRAAMTLFTTGPDGMTGNDDLGTMSAWYVLSSIGLYPTMSGGNFFVLTSPQFEQVRVRIGEYGPQGGELTVSAPGTTDERRYITAATLNGSEWSKPWLPWWRIRDGGEIAYEVSDQPGDWGTATSDRPPSVVSGPGVPRRTVDAALAPAEVAMPVSEQPEVAPIHAAVLVQAPGTVPVTLRTSAPDGWQAEPAQRTVRIASHDAPIQRDVPIQITVPANTNPGRYTVTTRVTAPGASAQTVSNVVVVSEASCAASGDDWCAIDLTDALDHDGTATVAQSAAGDFDGGGWSYDADLLPAAGPVEWGGTTYNAPDATGTASNFLEATGESVLLPEGSYGQLRIVGAAHSGDIAGEATVTYADGSTGTIPLELTDWAAQPNFGNTVALQMDHRIKAGQGVDGPPVALFETRVPLESAPVRSIVLPDDDRIEIYAMTLAS
jgi:predicted alpha-1,2-mannosidase